MRSGTLCRSRDVVWRRSLDAVLILPAGAVEPLTLAGSGLQLWELLEEPISIADLTSTLAEIHEVNETVVAHDLDVVLERLVKFGIVEEIR